MYSRHTFQPGAGTQLSSRMFDGVLGVIAKSGGFLWQAIVRLDGKRRAAVTARQLRDLDDHILRDIGVNRLEITHVATQLGRLRYLQSMDGITVCQRKERS